MGRAAACAVAAILLGRGVTAAGQALAVSPTIIDIPAGKHGAVIDVTNNSAEPIDIQIRPYDWHANDGHDELTDSETLRVSPSIATLAPGATQTLRMLVPQVDKGPERDWRILLDELPRPARSPGLQVKLRLSIPVFAHTTPVGPPDLRWSVADGHVAALNVGRSYVRFAALSVRGADGHVVALALGTTPYLLPGAQRHWPIAGRVTHVVGRIGSTDFTVPVTVDPVH